MVTRGGSKLRPRLHGSGRILPQIAVLFAWVNRNFCTVSALEWLFWMTPQRCIQPIMLHWVQIAIIVSLRNRTVERGGRQNACVANVTGLCVVVIFTKYQCFSVFYKKISLKEDEVWGNFFFKQNYCHACQTRFAVFLARPPCFVFTYWNGNNSKKFNFYRRRVATQRSCGL